MKKRFFSSLSYFIPSLFLVLFPRLLFPVCPVEADSSPMKCFWSGRIVWSLGILLVILAILFLFIQSTEIRLGLSIGILGLSVYTLLVPTVLIGVCAGAHMPCRSGTLPAVLIAGAALLIISVIHIFVLLRKGKTL
ncbi:MAG: DUF4418 family protein [Lachnospiraceae bacterium]